MSPRLSVVIPAYNEETRLPVYLNECVPYFDFLWKSDYEVLIVDDGSTDETAKALQRYWSHRPNIKVIRHERNLGKGAAVRTGMLAARGALRLFTDADGATPIGEVERLLAAVQAGADIAIGSRAVPGGIRRFLSPRHSSRQNPSRASGCHHADTLSTPQVRPEELATAGNGLHNTEVVWHVQRSRHILGRVFAALVRIMLGLKVHDTQCGFKLFTAHAAELLFPQTTLQNFLFDVEVLYLAERLGLRIAEVPVNWHDVPGSKVRLLKDGWQMLRGLWHIRSLHYEPRCQCTKLQTISQEAAHCSRASGQEERAIVSPLTSEMVTS